MFCASFCHTSGAGLQPDWDVWLVADLPFWRSFFGTLYYPLLGVFDGLLIAL